MDYHLYIGDESVKPKDSTANIVLLKKYAYTVLSENGLFKNGKQYDKGETILLDEKTGNKFIDNNDIEKQL